MKSLPSGTVQLVLLTRTELLTRHFVHPIVLLILFPLNLVRPFRESFALRFMLMLTLPRETQSLWTSMLLVKKHPCPSLVIAAASLAIRVPNAPYALISVLYQLTSYKVFWRVN